MSIFEERNHVVTKLIKQILHENSGGMKMTALVAEFTSRFIEDKIDMTGDLPPNFAEDFEKWVETLQPHHIHVLEYDQDMGTMWRSKSFVYTKRR